MLLLLLLPVALAADPSVRVLEDGLTVEGTVTLAVASDELRAILLDPWRTAQTAGSELQVERVASAGSCTDYRWTVPHTIKTVSYTARLCPTDTGVRATLLESEDLEQYRSEWWIEPQDGRVQVRYQLLSTPTFPLPRFLLRSTVKKEVADMLQAFQRSLGGG